MKYETLKKKVKCSQNFAKILEGIEEKARKYALSEPFEAMLRYGKIELGEPPEDVFRHF